MQQVCVLIIERYIRKESDSARRVLRGVPVYPLAALAGLLPQVVVDVGPTHVLLATRPVGKKTDPDPSGDI